MCMSLNTQLSVSVCIRLVKKLTNDHYCNDILQAAVKQILGVHEQPAIHFLAAK